MKRYLVLFLVLLLLIPCMTVTASATTQGVIDAVDDLAAGLGTSQREIVDLLTSIDEWIYEAVVQLQDISTTLYSSIYEGYCVPMLEKFDSLSSNIKTYFANFKTYLLGLYNYFYQTSPAITVNTLLFGSNGPVLSSKSVSGLTWFTADLCYVKSQFVQVMYVGFKSLYDVLVGDTTLPDAFEEDKAPLETEMDSMIDSMETAPTISIDDIETEVDKITDFEPDTTYTDVLKEIFLNEIFLTMFTWSVILAMLGFILYGKR